MAVNVFKSGQTSSIASYAVDLMPFQLLCRKVLLNSAFADIGRFRELVAQHPPFGMDDIVINKDQASKLQPIILHPSNTESELHHEEDASVASTPAPKPPPLVRPIAPKKEPEAKLTPTTPNQEPASSTPWSIIVVLIVAATGLLWLVLKKRK